MKDTAAFWDGIAARYAARRVGDEAAYVATLERVRHRLRPDWDVLEIGCGTGTTAVWLADSAGAIVGTDLSTEMLRIARDRAAALPSVTFEQSAVSEAGAGRRFDAVLGFNILHLLDDLPGALAHLRTRLDPGGLLITKTPCLGARLWLRPVIWGMQRLGKVPPALRYLTPAELQTTIRAAGFEIVETGDYPKSLPNHFIVAKAV